MENLSLNNDSQNQQSFQIATRENNYNATANSKIFYPQHIYDDIPKDSEGSPIKRRYTSARNLRAISQNYIIAKPYQGIKTRSSFRMKSNMALI